MWYLYILKSEKHGKFYVGISQNPARRFQQHNSPEKIAFTSKGLPWKLMGVWEAAHSEAEAVFIERFIKKQKNTRIIHHLLVNKPLHGPWPDWSVCLSNRSSEGLPQVRDPRGGAIE